MEYWKKRNGGKAAYEAIACLRKALQGNMPGMKNLSDQASHSCLNVCIRRIKRKALVCMGRTIIMDFWQDYCRRMGNTVSCRIGRTDWAGLF